jgi:hypothetical protein
MVLLTPWFTGWPDASNQQPPGGKLLISRKGARFINIFLAPFLCVFAPLREIKKKAVPPCQMELPLPSGVA